MLIKVSELMIPQDNPFQNDALGRLDSAEILTQLISTINEPFVLSIDSIWGSGKTTFLKMWRQYLLNNGYKVLYFNAWENDINENSLAALIAEIKKGIKNSSNEGKSRRIYENIKSISKKIMKRSIPVVVKLGTAGIIDSTDFIEDTLSSATEEFALNIIEDYEKKQEEVEKFKKELEEYAHSIIEEESKPLLFIIDELDRCRPNFAIEILEKAKHFFNVKNIIFVISIDKRELGNSIKAIYGNEFDTDGYLRRFIDLTYIFPEPNIESYCRFLIERFSFNTFFKNRTHHEFQSDNTDFLEATSSLFKLTNFSLRTIEQCFSQISLVLRTTQETQYLHPIILVFLIVLKNDNPTLYYKLKQKECLDEDIFQYLYSLYSKKPVILIQHFALAVEAYVVYFVSSYLHSEDYNYKDDFIVNKYKQPYEDSTTSQNEKNKIQTILRIIEHLHNWHSGSILKLLFSKIELTQRFH